MYTSIANHGLTVKDKLIENYYILNQIVQSIDTGIAVFYEKKLVHVNNEIRRITGRTYKYLESNLMDLFFENDIYSIRRKFISVMKHYTDKAEFYINIKMADGSVKRLLCRFALIRIVEKTGLFVMVHELAKLPQPYDAEMMASNLAHELRSPLNAIIGFSDILADDNLSSADRRMYLNYIRSGCISLLHLLDDFSDFNKLEHNKVEIEESMFDINKLFDELEMRCRMYCGVNHKDNLTIECVKTCSLSECLVSGDEQRIKQIMVNLLTNAVKFTPEGKVSFRYDIEDGVLVLSVKDTGIGIPPDMQTKIFGRFTQVGTLKDNNGLGLGLDITKNLVDLMKGTIDLTSQIGAGSEFVIRLPQHNIKSKHSTEKCGKSLDFNFLGKKILIAEDARINYILLEKILSKTGCNIIWAQNGEQCITMFQQNRDTNLILMDMQMPVKDGYEAAREIHAMDSGVPIVAQTAFSMDDERERILNCGCTDYIAKPIDRFELLKKIDAVIR